MRRLGYTLLFIFFNGQAAAELDYKQQFLPTESYLHVLIYSDGILSALGHDHVIAADDWQGHFTLNNASDFQASIVIELQNLLVDREADRALYPHLAQKQQPSAEDIVATKNNMLSKDILDVEHYPVMRTKIKGDTKSRIMTAYISLRNHETTITTVYERVCENNLVKYISHFRLLHKDIGLKPYAALFGAISIAQPIDFNIKLATSAQCS